MSGFNVLTAVLIFENEGARLIVDTACRRGHGLGSVLEARGLRPDAHHNGYEPLGHGSCSFMLLHSIQALHAECQMDQRGGAAPEVSW